MDMKIIFALVLAAFLPLFAQPVFTADDLPDIGYEAVLGADSSDEVPVDVGTAGGPQTWDFSPMVNDFEIPFDVIAVAGTPAEATFNDKADFVYHIENFPVPGQDSMSIEWWQYYKVETDAMMMVGEYRILTDTFEITQLHDYNPDLINTPQPFQMGSTWRTSMYAKDTLNPVVTLDTWEMTANQVDAWGTITVPKGTYEALRYITYDTIITRVNIFTPGTPDTTATINYTWVASGTGPVMILRSEDGEINPDYDTAGTYMALISNNIPDAVEETNPALVKVSIDGREVFFSNPKTGYVEAALHDATGSRTCELYSGTMTQGEHRISLPDDLGKGIYFVRLHTLSGSFRAKLVIVR